MEIVSRMWTGYQFVSHVNRSKTVDERIWEKVSPEPNSGCWLWTAATDKDGYGLVRIDKKNVRAHRHMLEQRLNAAIPDDLQACHTCHTPACVNPDHLYAGTNRQNQNDAVARGTNKGWARIPRCKAPAAKLTEDDVRSIRARASESTHDLAIEFGVGRQAINRILSRKRWGHVV
jgi:hypothetical protein